MKPSISSGAIPGVSLSGLDYQALFESAPGLLVAVLPDAPTFTVVAVTDAYLQASRMPRSTLVGSGLFQVFAAHRSHPECLAVLENVRSSFNRVLATRQSDTMPVQRFGVERTLAEGGGLEECYWSPVNSPVCDPHGAVRFIIHRVDDVSEAVRLNRPGTDQGSLYEELRSPAGPMDAESAVPDRQLAPTQYLLNQKREAEQRLAISEARFRLAFSEAPIGMVLTDLRGAIQEVNQAYADMLGFSREELIGHGSGSFTHPDDQAASQGFVELMKDGSPAPRTLEKRYIRKSGELLWARVSAGMRRDEAGRPIQLIAVVEDITERKRAEERLRAIYDGTHEYISLLAPDGTLLETNRASLEFAGNRREAVVGRAFWETPWFAHTPGAPEAVRQGVGRAAAGEVVRYEASLFRPSGELEWFDISLHPVRSEDGEVVLIVHEGRRITERKALELRNAFLVRLDDVTRPLTDAYQITQTTARLLGEHLDASRCAYADVEEDEDTFNLTGDYNNGTPSIVGRYRFAQFGDECLRLMREGTPYVVVDSEEDPRVSSTRASYRATLIRAVVCVPLLKAGRFVAAMAVHQTTPRRWRHDEIELVSLVANRCWESIERVHVTRELREREQRFQFLAESIPQMVWTATPDGLLDYVNGQGTAYFAAAQADLLGQGWVEWVHPDDRRRTADRWKESLQTGKLYETAFRLRRGGDGCWRWHLVRALPLIKDDGAVVQWFGTCTDIEDQKRAEANLQQQWDTFDTVLSHTPDFAYIFDLQGRFTYINRSMLALWQRSFEDSVGRNFFDLGYPPELAARLQAQIQQVVESRQAVRDQAPYTDSAGRTRHYEYIFVPVLDAAGQVESVAGSTRDLTEQRLAANQIEEDRRRWRELLLQTPAAIAILRGPEHKFEWVNANYLRLVSRPADEILGRTVREALPEMAPQAYLGLLDRVYRTGQAEHGHEALVSFDKASDGTLQNVYVNFVYAPTRDFTGQIDGIFVHATDVTDMVAARKQVEESEQQFRTLAETIPHLAWMADETGHIFWYNRRWYDYTGSTFGEMAGWGWQKVHDPSVLPQVLIEWGAAIATGDPFEMVFPLKGADGTFRTFLTRGEPVRDSQGRVVRWFGTNTDITTQQRTEKELRRMNRELEEFAYVASHDLQEPLRMVNIYTDLILRTLGEREGPNVQHAAFVRQGVSRMEALIHDLLAFSRTVHSEAIPASEADLSASLQEALAVLKNRIEETAAVIVAGPLPAVRGDTAQMAHVFQNVLSNALKYRKPGVPPEIRISSALEDAQWIVSVQDNGIGFESRYAERIFGLFKRLHKDEYPGTGLGLAICKRIVERYGGRMWAEAELGRGAVFHFSLPSVRSS